MIDINKIRSISAEYEEKLKSCSEAGLKEKAADIAADGVGRRALEVLPELVDELEHERCQGELARQYYIAVAEEQGRLRRRVIKAELAREELAECCEELCDLVDTLSTWMSNAYIDTSMLPDIGRNDIEPPHPEDVVQYAKECSRG